MKTWAAAVVAWLCFASAHSAEISIEKVPAEFAGPMGKSSNGQIILGNEVSPGVRDAVYVRNVSGGVCRARLEGKARVVDGYVHLETNRSVCGTYIFALSDDLKTLTAQNETSRPAVFTAR